MLNAVYRLVAPRRFEVEFGEVPLFGQEVIVRPTHLSICHAEQTGRSSQTKASDGIDP